MTLRKDDLTPCKWRFKMTLKHYPAIRDRKQRRIPPVNPGNFTKWSTR